MTLFRNTIAGLLLATSSFLAACSSSPEAGDTSNASLATAAADTYSYLLPLFELGRTRAAYRNVFLHRPTLADASSRSVTTPNNDTLYSSAWLDLSGGPLIIQLPASAERYFSLALMDFYSNNFAVRGTRVDGGEARQFWLAGPDWSGSVPEGVELVRSPTRSVWALGRTYVRDQADIPAAVRVQAQLRAAPAPGTTASADQPSDRLAKPDRQAWLDYFGYAQQLLNENPPPAADAAFLHGAAARLGIGVGATFDPARFSAAERDEISTGAQQALARARTYAVGEVVNGWQRPQPQLGNFGTDYAYRAAIALFGLGALPNAEALYFFGAGDAAPQRYDGAHSYVMEFTGSGGGLPPVGAFWSLTLYQAEESGQLFFYDNPPRRYAIKSGDSTLKYETDGGLKIYLGNAAPPAGYENNWLPAPAGPFATAFRTYLPDARLLDGRYQLPPLRRLD